MTFDSFAITTWMADTIWVAPLGRLLVAALLGGLIGLEREHHGRSGYDGLKVLERRVRIHYSRVKKQ